MARGYVHLELAERSLIETQLRLGLRPAAIALGWTRARSTVLREMRRNGWQSDAEVARRGRARIAGGYRCASAERRARLLAVMPRVPRKLTPGNPLWIRVVDHLRQGLSPAPIARTLARMPDPVQLSYETIYAALYTMPRGHLRSSLLALMRRRHCARRPRRSKDGRSKPSIPEMTLIDQRPVEVQMRLVPGHWEGRSDHRQGQPLPGRHPGRTNHPVRRSGEAEQQQGRRHGPSFYQDPQPLRQPVAPLHDLRSGLRDEASQNADRPYRRRRLLRPSPCTVGARHLGKYQRPAPPVPAQGN